MVVMSSPTRARDVFRGRILGVGSTSGTRVVVGMWDTSPLGTFADCMVASPTGRRILLAPTREVATYVGDTYDFDEVRVGEVLCRASSHALAVETEWLTLDAELGGPTPLGRLLRLIPARLGRSTTFATLSDPVARVVLRGVRTRGTAGNDRTEFYAASDLRSVGSVSGRFDDADIGSLADVWPEPRFGFSSTPRTPGLTSVTTTVLR